MARPDSDSPKGPARLHRREADVVATEEEAAAEEPLFATSRLPASNAAREAMAERARAARTEGGAAVDGRSAEAARRAGIGDVAGVTVHTGPAAGEAAAAVQAKAFTVGSEVFFGAGQYAPGTPAGDRLLGHELAHAAQQRGAGAEAMAKLEVTEGGDAVETDADQAGGAFARAAAGETVAPVALTTARAAIAREPLAASSSSTEAVVEEILTDAQARAAASFNRGRHLPADAWAKIAAVVGAPGAEVDAAMARAVARFQKSQGFDADGRVGDMTLQRISQQPGGGGLEDLVKNDSILYLGLNPSSRGSELGQLQGSGADVTGITGARTQDTAKVGKNTVDLNTDEGLDALMGSFPKLDAGRQALLKSFFESAGGRSKDELAMLARHLYDAEFGKRLFKRVVLSGHSGGWSIWGDDNGTLSFDYLARLASIFPGAVGQVEDLMLSACNTGQKDKLDQYTAIFPNLKSIWAYVGYSPSAATGSLRHIKEWEKATRGAADEDKIEAGREKVGAGSGSKDKNVATWTKETGQTEGAYATDSPEANLDFATLKATVDSGLTAYRAAYEQGNIDQDALNALYTQLQALVGMFGSQLGDERDTYDRIMRRTLNLRHWTNILRNYMAEHGTALKAAWGDSMPRDFGTASRAKVLGYLASFGGDTTSAAYQQAISMLKNLDSIPENWN